MITAVQMRAARGMLNWSARELAERSGISLPTVQRMEAADGEPRVLLETMRQVVDAFSEAGIEFIPAGAYAGDGGVGVRLRKAE